uniref:Uncharacterized protein n=1 Tax=Bos indicus x Bos taurus TaxID=30522 RepID=A0A4W2CV99_BOBOX
MGDVARVKGPPGGRVGAVRVWPLNRRELELNTKWVVEMEGNQKCLHFCIWTDRLRKILLHDGQSSAARPHPKALLYF